MKIEYGANYAGFCSDGHIYAVPNTYVMMNSYITTVSIASQ